MSLSDDPLNPEHEPDEDEELTYHETIDSQAEFQGLLEEKGDWQEAVDAQMEGEEPEDPKGNVSMP